jgi:hypothetical protein
MTKHAQELYDLALAFKSYLEDNSRSTRRRHACLYECNSIIERLKPTVEALKPPKRFDHYTD